MSIYEKLNQAREDFHAIKIEKSGHNKFAGYKYFELADFLIPAMKVLKANGLCAYVSFPENAIITCVDIKETEHKIVIESPLGSASLKGCHEIQNIGACETYQRRYLWMALLEIVEHDAIDSSEGAEAKPLYTKEQIEALRDSADTIIDALADNDISTATEAWFELSREEMKIIWTAKTKGGYFTQDEKAKIQKLKRPE